MHGAVGTTTFGVILGFPVGVGVDEATRHRSLSQEGIQNLPESR